jgi:hypothetical protein
MEICPCRAHEASYLLIKMLFLVLGFELRLYASKEVVSSGLLAPVIFGTGSFF